MTSQDHIDAYLAGLPEAKRADLLILQEHILKIMPGAQLWFLDGKGETGKVVTNPNIGFGSYTMRYANGATKPFYQVGLSANTSGVSVFVMGLKDRKHLPITYGDRIGKATVTGYCIKFKRLADIDLTMLEAAIRDGIAATEGAATCLRAAPVRMRL